VACRSPRWPGGAFSRGMPPFGRGRADDLGRGLVGMESEPSERISFDLNAEPASPATAGAVGASSKVDADVIFLERHPVDAALAQSSSHPRRRHRASGHVLVSREGDPFWTVRHSAQIAAT